MSVVLQEKPFKREFARKTAIASTLELPEGDSATRVNILATAVDKSEGEGHRSIIIDDGTGQIQLRFFDDKGGLFESLQPGDFALIIGKARRYMGESYIAPEIIKRIDNIKWAEVRKLELRSGQQAQPEAAAKSQGEEMLHDAVSKEKIDIYKLVKQLDSGNGADTAEVIARAAIANAEGMIREMLKAGDLFEALPGKLKVLE